MSSSSIPTIDEKRTLKVEIPRGQHLKLHVRKLLKGEPIAATVTRALALYFEEQETKPPER